MRPAPDATARGEPGETGFPRAATRIKTVQIGLAWFPERAGGLQRYFYDLVLTAPKLGIDVRGFVAGTADVAKSSDQRVLAFGGMSDPLWSRLRGARRAIGQAIRMWDPDLVVSHFSLYTCPALDLIDRPLIVHFHGPWALEGVVERNGDLRQRVKAWVEKAVYRKASRFIVLSEAFGAILSERYGIPAERIRIIPGGVDISRFAVTLSRKDARMRLGWPTDRPIIFAVRRLVRRMGLENLIDSMALTIRTQPEALLLIGGQGQLAPELAVRIVERGLERSVRLVGFISDEDLPFAYRSADISVVPTTALEGFGLIAAESLAVGTPVLVTPVGGLPEVVRGLSSELVFDGTSAIDLSTRIAEVLSDLRVLPSAAACRSYAATQFGWDNVIEKIGLVYKEAL